MTEMTTIFDRNIVRSHRDRAASHAKDYDFLVREITDRMRERLAEITTPFSNALQIGALAGRQLDAADFERYVLADLSGALLQGDRGETCVIDEEKMPFARAEFDLIFAPLTLHWVNDLPGSLIQMNSMLRPNGLFLGAMLGGETLFELRTALMKAEMELMGGISPRISPMADIRDLGGLLQRAGFALPVTDMDVITVDYDHPMRLMADLRGMAETNAVLARRKTFTSRQLMVRASEIYMEEFAGPDGRIPATFQILYMTGWHPHESQQKPLKPGSAKTSLASALKTPIE